ncbi:helix-turn-helix transcriptional regulator [Edaphobacter sp. HDX4]|uniref:helix-turn-helix transcriptional regulator n=1 Tax=Edaphobacter sp. HDX4 TaxID=2794064 RepID=UPI002FE6A656
MSHASAACPGQVFYESPENVSLHGGTHEFKSWLSPREISVLRLIRDSYRNKQVAQHLGICETTVNFHIVEKLQANDRTHAVTIGFRRGLLELE